MQVEYSHCKLTVWRRRTRSASLSLACSSCQMLAAPRRSREGMSRLPSTITYRKDKLPFIVRLHTLPAQNRCAHGEPAVCQARIGNAWQTIEKIDQCDNVKQIYLFQNPAYKVVSVSAQQ